MNTRIKPTLTTARKLDSLRGINLLDVREASERVERNYKETVAALNAFEFDVVKRNLDSLYNLSLYTRVLLVASEFHGNHEAGMHLENLIIRFNVLDTEHPEQWRQYKLWEEMIERVIADTLPPFRSEED